LNIATGRAQGYLVNGNRAALLAWERARSRSRMAFLSGSRISLVDGGGPWAAAGSGVGGDGAGAASGGVAGCGGAGSAGVAGSALTSAAAAAGSTSPNIARTSTSLTALWKPM